MIAKLLLRMFRAVAHREYVDGLELYVPLATREVRLSVKVKLQASLDLIARYDPHRHAQLLRNIAGIVVWREQITPGGTNEETRFCMLSQAQLMQDRYGLATATTLVHEGTHARLVRHGLKARNCDLGRMERTCKRAELAFLDRLPAFTGKEQVLAETAAAADAALTADYSGAARSEALVAKLREIGWPRWILQFFE